MLNESVSKAPYLVSKDKKLMDRYYLSPSSATCYTDSGQPVGACIKQIWLDKKDYPISNPVTAYNQFTFDAGKMWEDWLIQQYKKLNIYIDSNVKLVDNDLSIWINNLSKEFHIDDYKLHKKVYETYKHNSSLYDIMPELLYNKTLLLALYICNNKCITIFVVQRLFGNFTLGFTI